jgi:hypothetical protein
MPKKRSILPTAEDVFARLDRPPWHAVSSAELAKLLGVHLNTVWNWTMRGTGPEPEPGDVYVRASNRRFFLPSVVLAWLSGQPAWAWSGRWLVDHHMLGPDPTPDRVRAAVAAIERGNVLRRRWRVRPDRYLERLREVHGAAAQERAARIICGARERAGDALFG